MLFRSCIAAGSTVDLAVVPAAPELGVLHRRVGSTEVYLLAMTGPGEWRGVVRPRAGGLFQVWDPMSAEIVGAGTVGDGVSLALGPYEAVVIVVGADGDAWPAPRDSSSAGSSSAPDADGQSLAETGPWQVSYGSEEPVPVTLPHRWEDDRATRHLSGTAAYATTFTLAETRGITLVFGDSSPVDSGWDGERGMVGHSFRAEVVTPVGEVAEVRVDGVRAGIVWCPPYVLELGELAAGDHTLTIAVSNTLANALAVDEQTAILVEQVEATYGRRFRMQDLERADATVSSGLLSVPRLVVG